MISVQQNFLPVALLNEIISLKDEAIKSHSAKWYTSLSWPENVRLCSGTICILSLEEYISAFKAFYVAFDDKYQNYDFMVQLNVWTPGSYIPWHKDGSKDFASTIYLNADWDVNAGGIFLYKDHKGDIRGEFPEFNKMVVNNNQVEHHVTMIPHSAKEDRVTIQVWGWRNDNAK